MLTIGYLILEADQVDVTTSNGRTVPATVVAYDHATGFGLLRPIGPLDVKPIRVGASGKVDALDRLMIATGAGEESVSVATVVSQAPVRGLLGVPHRRRDLHLAAAPGPQRRGAHQQGGRAGGHRLAVRDGRRSPRASACRATCSCPVDLLKPVLDEMIATGRQKGGTRPWLGISSLEEDGRIKVLRVSADGPAERAGIKPGDIILSVSGQKVEKLDEFYRKIWSSGAPGVDVVAQGAAGRRRARREDPLHRPAGVHPQEAHHLD